MTFSQDVVLLSHYILQKPLDDFSLKNRCCKLNIHKGRFIMSAYVKTIVLLICSNTFMTFAWYAHLKNLNNKALWLAIMVSWGIAFFEYMFQVPANRIGFNSGAISLAQ